ncbi:MAG: lysylphosphatidylglycerol synthase transmembrane domain-containing protein [Halobacteriota archaeon]
MAGERLRATVLGFLAAAAVFTVLFYVAGVDDLVQTLSMAEPAIVGLVIVATLAWLASWGGSLRTVLSVLGVDLSAIRSFFVFAGATFSNNITPFGQAGGEPVTALLITEVSDAEYETSLAAIASVDTLNFVPSIIFALIGAGYYTTEVTLGRNLEIAIGAVVGLAVIVPSVVYVGWQHRYELERRVIEALTPLIRRLGRRLPRVTAPSPDGIERRITGFFSAIERVATSPRGLTLALGLSAFGWFLQMLGLWLSFYAIGHPIAFSIALFVVPIGAIAGVTPLPGGVGGIESVLVVLIAAASPAVGFDVATAGVVIFRGAVYWTPTLIGGVTTSLIGAGRGI